MESLCDSCPVPGKCCRVFTLNGGLPELKTVEEVQTWIDKRNASTDETLPFKPLFRDSKEAWWFWCPNLSQKTGRCLDYENRPETCWSYEPKSSGLCVLFEEPAVETMEASEAKEGVPKNPL